MDKETLADVIFDIGHKENDACAPSTCKVVADYILDNFVSEEDYQKTVAKLIIEKRQKELDALSQDSKPRECDPYKPKPTLPDVPEKFDWGFDTMPIENKVINDLINCYSALKKVVEEKL